MDKKLCNWVDNLKTNERLIYNMLFITYDQGMDWRDKIDNTVDNIPTPKLMQMNLFEVMEIAGVLEEYQLERKKRLTDIHKQEIELDFKTEENSELRKNINLRKMVS